MVAPTIVVVAATPCPGPDATWKNPLLHPLPVWIWPGAQAEFFHAFLEHERILEEVLNAVYMLNIKAQGFDGILVKVYKLGFIALSESLSKFLCWICGEGVIP